MCRQLQTTLMSFFKSGSVTRMELAIPVVWIAAIIVAIAKYTTQQR